MDISIIVAMTKKRVIGKDNKLIWHIPEDLKNFKKITNNKTVIMGRKTFESILSYINKPLPNRTNIIITRNPKYEYNGEDSNNVMIVYSIQEAIKEAEKLNKDIFIIGGASIYKLALPYANKLYISWIKKDYDGNVFFPDFNLKDYSIIEEKEFNEFKFVIYKKQN